MTEKPEQHRALGFPDAQTYGFPNIVNVEVYRGACPCRCVHCPVGQTVPGERGERFGAKAMSLDLFGKIVAEMAGFPHAMLRIHSVGEPLLWADLVGALELAARHAVKSWIFTSAVTDDASLLLAVCEHASIVEVSVNSIAPEDYRRTKGIDAFAQVARHVERMHDHIVARRLKTRLIVSRVQSTDRDADREFVGYWKSSGFVHDAFVRSYHTYNDLINNMEAGETPAVHQPCLVHWARFNISTDGDVVVCFNELFKATLDASLVLGNVTQQSIREIWHGRKLTALRQAELAGDYAKLDFQQALPCKDCASCQPLHGNNQTSEHQIGQTRC